MGRGNTWKEYTLSYGPAQSEVGGEGGGDGETRVLTRSINTAQKCRKFRGTSSEAVSEELGDTGRS